MAAPTRFPPDGHVRHRSHQVMLLVLGAACVAVLVVLALLSLAGWL